uniref:NADH-ubiquinone oxidoreductase chain 4L n=1 Tax=Callispa bowringii TaxID=2558238 RepID=A0A482JMM6_9CUCU|nr:NADH dehydrogenase subunit 4L [Callispa bowringii]QBP33866.1 NADH dehydrogenase subunit 4L [Callispa bowringii]
MSIIGFISGFFIYSLNLKHFLFMLLSLEFIMLSLYSGLFYMLSFNFINLFFCMIYLTITVCEGVLGLSLMVMMVRLVGNDLIKSFSLLW